MSGEETSVAKFLTLITHEWVAYLSDGASFRQAIHEIAAAHGAEANIAVQVDSAVLTVYEEGRAQTIVVVGTQHTRRLDRLSDMSTIIAEAKNPEADLDALGTTLVKIMNSPPLYPAWLKSIGIVLFVVGFAINVQATWASVWLAMATGVIVALVTALTDRFGRISLLTAFFSSIAVSATVLLAVEAFSIDGEPVLYMIPALFIFIPGYVLSVAIFEMARGRVNAGAVQLVYVIFGLLLLFLGVIMGAALTGSDVSVLFGPALSSEFPYVVSWLAWVVFAAGFTLTFSAPMQQYGWILLVTLVAFASQQLGTVLFGEIVGAYLAATVMVGVALFLSRGRVRAPAIMLSLGGFYVLTAGALGLEGITAFVTGNTVEGYADLFKMLTIGMAIALGMITAVALGPRQST